MQLEDRLVASRILVVGSARQSLVACRDLGRAGAVVDVALRPDERDLASASRWVRARHVVPDPQADPEAFGDALRQVVEAGHHDLVFPAGDEYLAALSADRDQLPAAVPLAPHDMILTVLDKLAIVEAARRAGVPVPRTELATDEAVSAWVGPAIVKDRSHWNPGAGPATHRAAIAAADPTELAAAVTSIRSRGGRPVLQSPVEGRMLCFSAFRSPAGTVSGRVQQTSDHLWPVPLGTTARATTVPIDRELAAAVGRLLDELAWVGMANLQLFEHGDGHALIDFNGRFNHSLALAIAAGVRFPTAWARAALTGDDIVLPDGRPGVKLSFLGADVKRALVERRGGLLSDLGDTLRFAATARHSIPSLRDPGPALRYLSGAGKTVTG